MKNIIYSFLGTTLDNHRKKNSKWNFWRPSVALAMQDDLHFDEYHIWYQKDFSRLLKEVVEDIRLCSPGTVVIPEPLEFNDPWDLEEVYGALYDYCSLQDFTKENEQHYIHITTGTHIAQICLFLLNEAHILPGKLIQTQPCHDGARAQGKYSVINLELARFDLLAKRFSMEQRSDLSYLKSGIDTKNMRFNELMETIEHVAVHSADPILLTGPTGAGKSRLARKIYELKKLNRQLSGRFIDVNCAMLRGDQAMATLFGHTKGAFTGAVHERPGLLKTADGGMLFLDEIGELGPDEQAMLLRAIEEKKFLPLGSDFEASSSFQLICGTNRNLESEVKAGRFRDDLYQRINLWTFNMPGLAERREDIEPNVEYELRQFARRSGRYISFNAEAWNMFMDFAGVHDWRGNFRELNAMITRMGTLATSGRIDVQTVQREISHHKKQQASEKDDWLLRTLLGEDYAARFDFFQIVQLREVLRVCMESKNLSDAGRKLFAVSRLAKKTGNDADRLSRYLAGYGISFSNIKKADCSFYSETAEH